MSKDDKRLRSSSPICAFATSKGFRSRSLESLSLFKQRFVVNTVEPGEASVRDGTCLRGPARNFLP